MKVGMVNPGRRVLSPPQRADRQTVLDQVQLGTGPELASHWLPRLPSPAARQTFLAYLVAHPSPVMTPGLAGVVAQSLGHPEAVFEFTRAAVAELAPEDPRLQDFEAVVRAASGDRLDHRPASLLRLAGLLKACPKMSRDETLTLVNGLAASVVKTAETHNNSGVLLRMAREATAVCRELLTRLDPPPSLALGIIDRLAGEPEALPLGVALAQEPVTPERLTRALDAVRAAQTSTTPDVGPFQAADAFLLSALRAVDPRAADLAELAGMPGPQALERAHQFEPEQPAGGLVEEFLRAPAGLVAVAKLLDTTPDPKATALELTSRLPARDGSQWEQNRLTHQGHAVLTALLEREPQAKLALELAHHIGPEPRVFQTVHTLLNEGPLALEGLTQRAVAAAQPEALWLTSQRFEQMAPQDHPEFIALTRSILEGLPNPRQRLHFLDRLADQPVPRNPLEFVNWSQTMTEGLGQSVLPLLSGASSFAATLSGPTATQIEVGADAIDFFDGHQIAIQD